MSDEDLEKLLEEYSFEELLDLNGIDKVEFLRQLIEEGVVVLPVV